MSFEFIEHLNLYKSFIGRSKLMILDDSLWVDSDNEEYLRVLLNWADNIKIPTINFLDLIKSTGGHNNEN